MQLFEKGGVQIRHEGAVLGLELMDILQAPEHLDSGPSPTRPVAHVDLTRVVIALNGLTAEVRLLRRDLSDRSLESRFRRLWLWMRRLFQRS